MTTPVATRTPPSRSGESKPAIAHAGLVYRPALDGLRAVAVYLVLAFHAGAARLSGGFIGVDTFFVLSGYLVTRLILADLLRGSFDLTKFYGRRVRRLLPAALVTLVLVSIAWLLLTSPVDRLAILEDARSSALYFSNWHFAHIATDYFASNDNPTPLLHFWSLSVEEQFYVVWPLSLVALWLASGRSPQRALRLVGLVAAVGAVLSLVVLAATVHNGDLALAYYGTHTRAYQLLGGALLAVVVERRTGVTRATARLSGPLQLVALLALIGLATSSIDVGPSVRGIGAAVAAVTLLATLESRPGAPTARLLSLGPLTFLGKISYGTYLWHYPTLVVVERFASMGPRTLTAVAALVATSLAALSYQLLELPIRRSPMLGRHSRAVVATGLVASLVVGMIVIPAVLRNGRLPSIAATGGPPQIASSDHSIAPVAMAGFDVEAATKIPAGSPAAGPGVPDATCTTVPIEDCILVQGTGKRILLLGDSHAAMLVPAFRALARKEGATLALAAKSGCPWQQTLLFTRGDPECGKYQEAWYGTVIPAFQPDIIILASRATDHVVGSSYGVKSTDPSMPEDASAVLAATTERSLRALAASGRMLVVEEPVPVSTENAMSCLSGVALSSDCSFVTDGASAAELSYRALAQQMTNVRTLDLDPLVCPDLPVCDPIANGFVVRLDHDHITEAWSAYIADDLDKVMHELGAF